MTATSVPPYTDTYVYNAQGGPLELLRQQSGVTSRYWYVLDGRGNVVTLTTASGSVVDRYGYDQADGASSHPQDAIAMIRI